MDCTNSFKTFINGASIEVAVKLVNLIAYTSLPVEDLVHNWIRLLGEVQASCGYYALNVGVCRTVERLEISLGTFGKYAD